MQENNPGVAAKYSVSGGFRSRRIVPLSGEYCQYLEQLDIASEVVELISVDQTPATIEQPLY